MRFLGLSICVVAAALALAGCGGDDQPQAEGGDEPTAQAWADEVCTRIDGWQQELRDIVAAEEEGSGMEAVRQKLDRAAAATDDLLTDLQGIGAPDTESGSEAKDEVDALAESTKERVDRIRTDAEDAEGAGDALQIAASIATELDEAQQEARATFDRVQDLDPAGELRDGIESSESCDELRSSAGG
jgi:hypothetical protein